MAKKLKNAYAEKEKIFERERRGVLSPRTSVCVHPAYKLHTHHSGCSSKPNAHVLGHVMAVKHPDLMG